MISLPGSVCVSRVLIGWLQQHDAAENPIVRCHTLVTLKSSGLHIRLRFLFHWVQGARSSGPSFLNNTSKSSNSLRATGILFIPFTFALKRGWNDAGCAVYRCFCSGRAREWCAGVHRWWFWQQNRRSWPYFGGVLRTLVSLWRSSLLSEHFFMQFRKSVH